MSSISFRVKLQKMHQFCLQHYFDVTHMMMIYGCLFQGIWNLFDLIYVTNPITEKHIGFLYGIPMIMLIIIQIYFIIFHPPHIADYPKIVNTENDPEITEYNTYITQTNKYYRRMYWFNYFTLLLLIRLSLDFLDINTTETISTSLILTELLFILIFIYYLKQTNQTQTVKNGSIVQLIGFLGLIFVCLLVQYLFLPLFIQFFLIKPILFIMFEYVKTKWYRPSLYELTHRPKLKN